MSGLAQKQSISQKQIQKLSQGQRQSLAILQMGYLELKEEVEKQLRDNPMADIEDHFSFHGELSDEIADTRTESLASHIFAQLDIVSKDLDLSIIDEILSQCDSNGWLKTNEKKLAQQLRVPQSVIHMHRITIMQCDPEGTACLNLSECLACQLHPHTWIEHLALRIIQDYLAEVPNYRIGTLKDKLNCTDKELAQAISLISSLNPRPADQYSIAPSGYIRPEVRLEESEEGLKAVPMKYFTIRVNQYEKKNLSAEEKKFMKEYSDQANHLIYGLNRRETTLCRVMQVLADTQKEYLLHGMPKEILRIQDVADQLKLNVTTVCRAMQDKYYEYEDSIFAMNGLLSKEIGGVSVDCCQRAIVELIDQETEPMSDQAISEQLQMQGILCSRRTVAKYRNAVFISDATKRRKAI